MEEYKDSFIPPKDPRHQVVERVVRHLAERNQDIPEISTVPWSVHVVDSPTMNAFVLPVWTYTTVPFQNFTHRIYAEICTPCRPMHPHMIKSGPTVANGLCWTYISDLGNGTFYKFSVITDYCEMMFTLMASMPVFQWSQSYLTSIPVIWSSSKQIRSTGKKWVFKER